MKQKQKSSKIRICKKNHSKKIKNERKEEVNDHHCKDETREQVDNGNIEIEEDVVNFNNRNNHANDDCCEVLEYKCGGTKQLEALASKVNSIFEGFINLVPYEHYVNGDLQNSGEFRYRYNTKNAFSASFECNKRGTNLGNLYGPDATINNTVRRLRSNLLQESQKKRTALRKSKQKDHKSGAVDVNIRNGECGKMQDKLSNKIQDCGKLDSSNNLSMSKTQSDKIEGTKFETNKMKPEGNFKVDCSDMRFNSFVPHLTSSEIISKRTENKKAGSKDKMIRKNIKKLKRQKKLLNELNEDEKARVSYNISMHNAFLKSKGIKVLDDLSLLKKAQKKRIRNKRKKAEKWKLLETASKRINKKIIKRIKRRK